MSEFGQQSGTEPTMNSNEDAAPARHRDAMRGMPGAQLAAQRQAYGWSVEDVADQLKLAPRQVVAIEADNYAALPGKATVRGFIRAYAKILKMDAAPLVAQVALESDESENHDAARREKATPFSQTRLPSMSRRGLPTGAIAAGVAAVFALLLLAVHMGWVALPQKSLFGEREASAGQAEVASAGAPLDASGAAAPPAQDVAAATAAAAQAQPQTDAQTQPQIQAQAGIRPQAQTAAQGAPGQTPAQGSLPAVAAAPQASSPKVGPGGVADQALAANTGGARLVLTLRQDSWIEVRRGNGSSLISRVVKSGATESFDINEPVLLIVGKPEGVDATFRGAPMHLQAAPGTTTARVNLK